MAGFPALGARRRRPHVTRQDLTGAVDRQLGFA
jgi:hypothetical protein